MTAIMNILARKFNGFFTTSNSLNVNYNKNNTDIQIHNRSEIIIVSNYSTYKLGIHQVRHTICDYMKHEHSPSAYKQVQSFMSPVFLD